MKKLLCFWSAWKESELPERWWNWPPRRRRKRSGQLQGEQFEQELGRWTRGQQQEDVTEDPKDMSPAGEESSVYPAISRTWRGNDHLAITTGKFIKHIFFLNEHLPHFWTHRNLYNDSSGRVLSCLVDPRRLMFCKEISNTYWLTGSVRFPRVLF